MVSNIILKPGDVVDFNSEYFIYQGKLPQGGGETILQFANDKETRGVTMKAFLREGSIVPPEEKPKVIKKGLSYVFVE